MIITRSPLRVSLGGGGTDLPSYYRRHGGSLVAAAIDKYVYVAVHATFGRELIVKYSKMERVKEVRDVRHPIVREALLLLGCEPALEIASMADIPAGTGLGSSGSFATALLKALHAAQGRAAGPRTLAEQACAIEIGRLGEPVGKQDPYVAAYGGLARFRFTPDDRVEVRPLGLGAGALRDLEDNLLLFFTGYSRPASEVLRDQDDRSRRGDAAMVDNLHRVKELGLRSGEALEAGDLRAFAGLMDAHWEHKRRRGGRISNPDIDRWYALGRANGALGGKLVGAGGGGFLMFYAEDRARLRDALRATPLREVRFRFDFEGTRVVVR